jgi:hypothetical protein
VSIIEQTEPAPGETVEEQLATLAKEYAEARDLASEAAARKDEIRDRIVALMGDTGKMAAGGFSISVSEQSRTTLDTKALRAWAKEEGFNLAPYEKVSSSKVLRVT